MAGTDSRFSASKFREAITFAMNMGLPDDTAQRATFKWTVTKEFGTKDQAGNPYDWTATPISTTSRPDVQVPVAVEFVPRTSQSRDTSIGNITPSRVTLTLLDTHFAQVEGADLVEFDGNEYVIEFVGPPIGLFEVTVYQIYAMARDES